MPITEADMDRNFNIETDRLILRAFRSDDLDELVAILSDWNVTQWLSNNIPFPFTRRDGEKLLENDIDDFAESDNVRFSIIEKKTMRHMGGIRLFSLKSQQCEVGYWLGPDFWNRGFASEVLGAVINWIKSEATVRQLIATTTKKNIASQKLLEKHGFEHQGTPPAEYARCGHGAECSEFYVLNLKQGTGQ